MATPTTRIAKFYLRNEQTGVIHPVSYPHAFPLEEIPLRRRLIFAPKNRKTRGNLTPKPKDTAAETKEIKKRNDDLKLRFAHHQPGRDDPVEDGRDIAFAGDVKLPSDRKDDRFRTRGNVAIGTTEEKELADLTRRGILKGEEGEITLESVMGEEPGYTIRVVGATGGKRRGGKGKGKGGGGERAVLVSSGGGDAGEVSPAEGEVVTSWEDFLAGMEAEGWVPVEDDLVSVAESWVVMQEEEEEEGVETT